MEYRFPKENGLTVIWMVAIWVLILSMAALYYLLTQIELQKTLTLSNKLELEEEDDSNNSNSPKSAAGDAKAPAKKNSTSQDTEEIVRMRLSLARKLVLAITVAVLALLVYLILVKSSANVYLAWLGMSTVFFVLFSTHLAEEIRRQRVDRISAMISMMLLLAMALHLIVYAQQQVADGQIHQGKARIIGYDLSQYDDSKKNDTVTRTDLYVAWGSSWGCPNHPTTYCAAAVQGALCETDTPDESTRKKKARLLAANNSNKNNNGGTAAAAQNSTNGNVTAAQNNSTNAASGKGNSTNATSAKEQELEKEVEGEEASNEELKKENDELKDENDELDEELEEYEDYTVELEDCIENEYTYYYDDDMYEDGYWDAQDWSSVWGEYSCEELFSEALEGGSGYDPDTEPGADDWPFINIYGNCKTCEAYIVDYFSTEHFQEVQTFKSAARNYGLAAMISLVITGLLTLKHRFGPTVDQEIELLSRHGGGSNPFQGAFA